MKLIILSGFLGSGKTTVLLQVAKELINQSQKVVVIENEVGDIGIDGSYLSNEGLQVQELFGGCICCTLTVGLVEAIDKLESLYLPDIILIEATGMARPADLKKTIQQYKQGIDSINTITLVDAERYKMLRNGLAPLFEAQIEAADTVLINKIDTVNKKMLNEITEDLKKINSVSRLYQLSIDENRGVEKFLKECL